MNTEPDSVDADIFSFSCPHCQGPIRFAVEAFQTEIQDYYYDEEWEMRSEEAEKRMEEWEKQRKEWEPYNNSRNEMADLIYSRQYAEAIPIIHTYLDNLVERLNADPENSTVGTSGFAFSEGARVLALMGDVEGLERMHGIVRAYPSLRYSILDVEQHQRELKLFQSIREAVRDNPNCLQTDVKILINEVDGHHVSRLIAFMDKAGEIVRVREGRKIRLSLADTSNLT